jgi:hypothetical protein
VVLGVTWWSWANKNEVGDFSFISPIELARSLFSSIRRPTPPWVRCGLEAPDGKMGRTG